MGSSMALNVRAAGHDLTVYDIRREAAAPHLAAGAKWADGPRQVAAAADVVFTSLPGPREVEAVALGDDGLLSSMRQGTVWFCLTTNSPSLIRRLRDPGGAGRGVHARRQGRSRAARALAGRAARRARPPAHVRSPGRSVPARNLRASGLHAASGPQGRDAGHRAGPRAEGADAG